jgi:hypothetical protein
VQASQLVLFRRAALRVRCCDDQCFALGEQRREVPEFVGMILGNGGNDVR